jgi:hypothetical protein
MNRGNCSNWSIGCTPSSPAGRRRVCAECVPCRLLCAPLDDETRRHVQRACQRGARDVGRCCGRLPLQYAA